MTEEEREEIIAQAEDQIMCLLSAARDLMREADGVRAEVEVRTGESVIEPMPVSRNVLDMGWEWVAGVREQYRHMEAAARLLKPRLRGDSGRTVGAVVKTADPATGARIVEHLQAAGLLARPE
ncbi:hypothetical protein [Streptomyces iconiensis]|uniref:Uncharacterized protein n=1 Tax=Streptomyces iconiensis TaxID=1384038 RepID=A0ABT6ZT17_9ACTN|nr:hypothetical protein [Streptomyces iconiensis]MDJ1131771.1 hypothetical protein [Streptomyces iconiensis]